MAAGKEGRGKAAKRVAKEARRAEAELLALRDRFPILDRKTYLISHSMGAMPRAAAKWSARYVEEWGRLGIEGYDLWVPRLRETADIVASLVGAPPGSVVFHQNVSTLISIAISAIFQPGGRRKVVTTNLNFPSVVYNWVRHESVGLEVTFVESPDGIVIPTERMIDAIDGDTLAVVVDHGIFRSGYLQDVGAIAKACREKGAHCIVDAYQTVGCVPVDVRAWDIDILVAGSHKWLCGGPGASYMYVRPELTRELHPRITGWFAHKRPFAFELTLEDADDAMRFATGTPNVPGVHAARAGIETIAKVGVGRIREKSVRLLDELVKLADDAGLEVRSPRDAAQRSGVLCLDFKGAEEAEAKLLAKGIHVDYRPQCGIRVSAHFYTTDDELFSIIPALRKLRR